VAAPAPSSRPSAPPPARATPSGPPTTTESAPAAAPTAPHSRSATRSSSPSGTCCRRARSTSTPAATTTLGATRPHHPTARRQARTPRLFSHAARSAGGDLNQNFSSQKTSGNASFRPSGGVAGSNPAVAALQAALAAVAPKPFHARGGPRRVACHRARRLPRFSPARAGRPRRAARSWLHRQRLRFGPSPLDHGQPVPSLEPSDGIE
jgi:hypothetical protein